MSADAQTEGTVLRKNAAILNKAIKQIDTSVGPTKLPQTKRALGLLLGLIRQAYTGRSNPSSS